MPQQMPPPPKAAPPPPRPVVPCQKTSKYYKCTSITLTGKTIYIKYSRPNGDEKTGQIDVRQLYKDSYTPNFTPLRAKELANRVVCLNTTLSMDQILKPAQDIIRAWLAANGTKPQISEPSDVELGAMLFMAISSVSGGGRGGVKPHKKRRRAGMKQPSTTKKQKK